MPNKIIEAQIKKGEMTLLPAKNIPTYLRHDKGREQWVDYLPHPALSFSHRDRLFEDRVNSERLHTHLCYELSVYTEDTDLYYVSENIHLSIPAGCAVLVKPYTAHMYINNGDRTYNRYILYFRPDLLAPEEQMLLRFAEASDKPSLVMFFGGKEKERLFELLARMETTLKADDEFSRAEALHTVAALFLMLCRYRPEPERAAEEGAPEFIHTLKDYIDANAPSITSITELSAKFFYSREYITRVFKRHYRMPIYEYISRRKIFYSCELLKSGFSVENAAKTAGFHNLSAYNKLFKKILAMTPSEFKKSR